MHTQKVIMGIADTTPIKSVSLLQLGHKGLQLVDLASPADIKEVFFVVAVV